MHYGVAFNRTLKFLIIALSGKLSIHKQITGFQIIALLGKLFDRVPAVSENTLVSINIGDIALTTGGCLKTRIVGEQPHFRIQLPYVDTRVTEHWIENFKFCLSSISIIGNGDAVI